MVSMLVDLLHTKSLQVAHHFGISFGKTLDKGDFEYIGDQLLSQGRQLGNHPDC